jgi:hypothetical protein
LNRLFILNDGIGILACIGIAIAPFNVESGAATATRRTEKATENAKYKGKLVEGTERQTAKRHWRMSLWNPRDR